MRSMMNPHHTAGEHLRHMYQQNDNLTLLIKDIIIRVKLYEG